MNSATRLLFVVYVSLSIYSLGGGVVEGFVYYPAWKVVGAPEFPEFHQSLTYRLIPSFVVPFFLSVVANAALFRSRPAELPFWPLAAALALNSMIAVVTIALAIPIQLELGRGHSIPAIDHLIGIDACWRLAPGLGVGALNLLMLERMLRRDDFVTTIERELLRNAALASQRGPPPETTAAS